MGIPKPVSLQEAQQLLDSAKSFEKQCEEHLGKLQGVAALSQQITSRTNVADEVDAIHSRWAAVHDVAVQWSTKLEKMVAFWQEFDEVQKVETWIDQGQRAILETPVNLSTPHVAKLEDELTKLKAFNKEISEKQAQLITLTQASDIAQGLAMEGATAVKVRVNEMKAKVTKFAEDVRQRLNATSDTILARHEFQGKLCDFENWMTQLGTGVENVNEVSLDKVDVALQSVHALLQEHSEKQQTFNTIYDEVKKILSHSSP